MYDVYKIRGTRVYIIPIDNGGDSCLHLSTSTPDITRKVSWAIHKTPSHIYEHNKKDLEKFCEIEVDEQNIAIAMLTDSKEVFI